MKKIINMLLVGMVLFSGFVFAEDAQNTPKNDVVDSRIGQAETDCAAINGDITTKKVVGEQKDDDSQPKKGMLSK